jgi:hypothetical protein
MTIGSVEQVHGAPDGGATMSLVGMAILGLSYLRRKLS